MYMEVAGRAQRIYLLALLHKDQVRLWLAQLDLTLHLAKLNTTTVQIGLVFKVLILFHI
jgi:hypothetical protein